jgi:hypothetical protein
LATIRLGTGTGGLLFPRQLAARIGVELDAHDPAVYLLRLFGIRTVLIGADLLLVHGDERNRALRTGVVIHLSDAWSAAAAGVRQQLPRRPAVMATVISTINAGLAVAALDRAR